MTMKSFALSVTALIWAVAALRFALNGHPIWAAVSIVVMTAFLVGAAVVDRGRPDKRLAHKQDRT